MKTAEGLWIFVLYIITSQQTSFKIYIFIGLLENKQNHTFVSVV